MNIREASFWKDIEPLFSEHLVGTRYCDYRILMDRCEQGLRRAQRSGAGVMLFVIRFRHKDNQAGQHHDSILELACQRVCSCLRACDSVCRLDDGRLAILSEDVTEPGLAALMVEKFQAALSPSLCIAQSRFELTLCVGIAVHPQDRGDATQLWRLAELRARQAFDNGMDAVTAPGIVAGASEMEYYKLIRELHQAYRNGEFVVVYQPVFNMESRTLVGMEALLRWERDEQHVLYPAEFLDLLEDSGLIVPIGESLLHDTCKFGTRLMKAGHHGVRVCVNVSGRQLEDGGFVLSVLDAVYDADLPPVLLQLEFSEQVLKEHVSSLSRLLPELRNAGVSIAIDHFGVTALSLADLVRLPVSLIKMDQSLVGGVMDDAVAQAIMSGSLAFARGAGIEVAAVGVEADEQLGALDSMGFKEAQGSVFVCPSSASGLLDTFSD
ncbi:EAL domain-containing protein (putative c-di-GMP-specific phosphodiesterase class I) [Thiogranum longum]|uniref:EAL domain-containing protein (Putative c-di-GMP-specific phosphodiesterase class I) n=1 Tax=Thiogranum longum TaxID=1537524 RepID=A0A4R1H8I4_9GAMM|nr:GGDEF domain-containing phosphodiesterase [Thiogranum longum]TCK18147.1 EAL domain-containing protein (putative c-di-GMP-specific phosphodiesterase class I) [Thiogranum longum]